MSEHRVNCDVNDISPEGIRKPCNCKGTIEDTWVKQARKEVLDQLKSRLASCATLCQHTRSRCVAAADYRGAYEANIRLVVWVAALRKVEEEE